jgi:hypothetical protein
MNVIYFICCLIVVLFLYIHIQHHYYVSNDLEVYDTTIVGMSKQEFDNLLSIRQPVLFNGAIGDNIKEILNLKNIHNLYSSFDVNINKAPLRFSDCIKLFKVSNKDISCNNEEFLNDTGLSSKIAMTDLQLRPSNLFSSLYDLILIPPNKNTPLQYNICYRTYIIATEGNVKIKCCPPKNIKFITFNDSIDVMNTISSIDCWDDKQNNELIPKVKFLEFDINNGQILYLPPYWCYSIKSNNIVSSVFVGKYTTYMNVVANSHLYIQQFLQQQNIKKTLPYDKIVGK